MLHVTLQSAAAQCFSFFKELVILLIEKRTLLHAPEHGGTI
jgi:hypothetical protein